MKALVVLLVAAGVLAGMVIARGPLTAVSRSPAPSGIAAVRAGIRTDIGTATGIGIGGDVTRAAEIQGGAASPVPVAAHDRSRKLARDIEAALVSVDDRERDRALSESLPQLMAIDPPAAARIVDRTPPGFNRDEARNEIARLWAAADLDGALEWLTTLDDAGDRRLATTEIRSQIAASDPATAIEISDLMDVGRDDGTLAHIAQMWAEENPSAAAAWAEKQPPGPLRDELRARIALVQAARE
jgi:hypothetical protein